jgi:hypothetical protein
VIVVPKTVPLSRRYEAHGRVFDAVTLRDPKYRDFIDIGDPVEFQPLPDGSGQMIVKHLDRVDSYVSRLVTEPVSAADLVDLDLVDALALEGGILDFFGEARRSRAKPTP